MFVSADEAEGGGDKKLHGLHRYRYGYFFTMTEAKIYCSDFFVALQRTVLVTSLPLIIVNSVALVTLL